MKGKKILCVLLALLLTASLAPAPAWAQGEKQEIQVTIQTGTGTSSQVSLSWEDSWFAQEPSQYQQGLAQASMVLSAAAYSQGQGEELANALTGLGFEQVELYHYAPEEKEAEDQVAYAFGCKKLADTDKTLVAVVIQGTDGSAQWRSNFRIGEGTEHQGFALARDEMMEQLDSYLATLSDDEPLFFLTGHSRGAAVANLAAQRLTEEGQPVYCYTFATPATVQKEAITEETPGIFNIISPQDPIPRLPLAAWDYGRYGQDRFLPSQSSRADYAQLQEEAAPLYQNLTGLSLPDAEGCLGTDRLIALLEELAPSLADYTQRQFTLGSLIPRQITLAEYFQYLSDILGGAADQTQATFVFLSSLQGDLAPLSQALRSLQGEDSLFYSHSMAYYLSWLSLGEKALDTQCAYLRLSSETPLSPAFQEDEELGFFCDLPLGESLTLTGEEKGLLKVERYQKGARQDTLLYVLPAGETQLTASWEPELSGPDGPLSPAPSFADVAEEAWYYEDVSWCAAQGLLEGDGQSFFPQQTVNRAMAVTVLYRLAGSPAVSRASFSDVAKGAWYAAPCAWARENGIAQGDEAGLFHPESPVTRQEMAAFFCRFAGGQSQGDALAAFADESQVSQWAREPLSWSVEQGLMEGVSPNLLSPQSSLTRSQLAALSARFEKMG